MYCPACFNDTLQLANSGAVHVIINEKKRDTGRFLFNLSSDTKEGIEKNLKKKLEEFFVWYGGFNNKEPISKVIIYSDNYICSYGCSIPLNTQISVVEKLISKESLYKCLCHLGEKYSIPINIELNQL